MVKRVCSSKSHRHLCNVPADLNRHFRIGHWIQDCPTNGDKAWDDKPKIKRTTGIPKSFLTEVEGPEGLENVAGMMVTSEGGFVIAKPDACVLHSSSVLLFPIKHDHETIGHHGMRI